MDAPPPSHRAELTLRVRAKHPDCAFVNVIGADLLPTLPHWRDLDMLKATCQFLVMPRPGFDVDAAMVRRVSFFHVWLVGIFLTGFRVFF